MAKKFDFLSPGINIREIDQSFIPQERDAEGPIIIGRTRKGPANKPVKIRNLDDYVSVFGLPVPGGAGPQGDVWRDGNTAGPTYAAYAAQSWLASENSPITVIRIAGDEHPQASTDAGKAGWNLGGDISSNVDTNCTAYGLFLIASASATTMNTGSLAAVFYAKNGYLALSGTAAGDGGTSVEQAGTFVKSVGSNCEFKIVISGSGVAKKDRNFNFSRNSTKYIRTVLNTNPQVTNTATTPTAQTEYYWLGESFTREVEDLGLHNNSAGAVYGILLPLQSGSTSTYNWGAHKEAAKESCSGWVISQQEKGQVDLFKLKSLHVGEDIQKDYMIAIENISAPANASVNPFGSFTVSIKTVSGQTVESYVNVNFNPSSPDYIAKRIGDQYMEWDETDRRYRTYGDFQNQSNIVYVDLKQFIKEGGGQGFLPAGFKGPVRPKGFKLFENSEGVHTLSDQQSSGYVASELAPGASDSVGIQFSNADLGNVSTDSADGAVQSTIVIRIPAAIAASGAQTDYTIEFTDEATAGAAAGAAGAKTVQCAFNGLNGLGDAQSVALAVVNALNGASIGNSKVRRNTDLDSGQSDFVASLVTTAYGANTGIKIVSSATDGESAIQIIATQTEGDITKVVKAGAGTQTGTTSANVGSGDSGLFAGAFVKGNVSMPVAGGSANDFVSGPTNFTASFNFPSLALRGDGTEGGAPDPYRAYYGIRPKISSTSRRHDNDYVDYLRRLPAGIDNYVASGDFEHSFTFTLDDLVINTTNNTVTYTASSYGSTSYTTSNTFDALLNLNVRQFLMPLHGGFEGFDVTEKEPLRDDLISSTRNDIGDHIHYTLNKALDSVKDPEVVPANLLLMPGIRKPVITDRIIATAEDRKDVLALIDLEGDYKPQAERVDADTDSSALGSVSTAVSSIKQRGLNSSYAAAFYPWVQISDNLNGGNLVWIPPSVAGLGAIGKSQAQSDVWFAPAGFNRGGLGSLGGSRGPSVLQARQRLDSKERDLLYEVNINPIATFPAEGVVIFGQKTLQADASALDRINVRRLVLYLKSRVATVARNLLFDQNVESTWNRFKSEVNPILSDARARFGLSDYKLVLDSTTTTADLIDRNVMYAKIFIKPARAIEYIVVDFVITRTGADFV